VPHKRLGTSTTPNPPKAAQPNRVWAVDFQVDATTDARPVKIVPIVDEHTRQCLGGLVERSSTGEDLLDEEDRIAAGRGDPAVLGCDHGPELAGQAMADGPAEVSGGGSSRPASRGATARSSRAPAGSATNACEQQQLVVTGPGPRRKQRREAGRQPPPAAPLAWRASRWPPTLPPAPTVLDAHRHRGLFGPTGRRGRERIMA
jgi:integrase-like protein